MRNTRNFIRKNQRVLAMSLLLASLYSCRKDVMEPTAEVTEESTVSAKSLLGNLLFHDNLDALDFLTSYVSKQTGTSYGITASTAQYYNGTKSLRFELRDSDPEVKNGTRSEISFPDCENLNRWYSYALYAPSDKFKFDDDDDVISQWHQGGGKTPALCLRVQEDHLFIRVLGKWHDLGAFEKDKWQAYVLHVKHSAGSDGLIEFWRDGKKIFNYSGANMYKVSGDMHNPNWKLGIYKSNWNGSGKTKTKERVIYFDDIKLGNEKATYNEMAPVQTNKTAPSKETSTAAPVTSGRSVVSLALVDAATEKDVLTIADGQTISLSKLGIKKCNIRANTAPAILGSVKFELSGKQSHKSHDNKAPYALFGDDGNGNFYYGNWNPPAYGTYKLTATPYSGDDMSGTVGTPKTITFTITK